MGSERVRISLSLFHFAVDLIDLYRKGVPFIRPFFLLEHAIRRRSDGYPWC
jgi:hypothetical protein